MKKDLISILLIDDDEDDYLITRDIVENINHQRYTLDWVDSYSRGLEIIHRGEHDVYLVDYRLGAHTGLDLLQEAVDMEIDSPIILLTGLGDIEIDNKALEYGAADYLVKNELDPLHLERSIRYSIQQTKNIKRIRQLNQELEKRVAARTEALSMAMRSMEKTNQELQSQIQEREKVEQKLRESQEEIRQALHKERELNELKSRFVSMASHEFRTPLGTILSSVNLIRRYPETEQQDKREKHINRIKSAVANLNNILNDFLSVDKLDSGAVHTHVQQFDLADFINEVIEEMRPNCKNGQHIVFDTNGSIFQFTTDKQMLHNILINLLSNAIKYSGEGSKIDLHAKLADEGLHITVRDYGIGIPEKEQNHLFERFFRANNVTNIQGTGLGLNIVKRYIDLLGGSISFQSEESKGTSFTIIIPQTKAIA